MPLEKEVFLKILIFLYQLEFTLFFYGVKLDYLSHLLSTHSIQFLLKNPIRLGGRNVIVQIDESCFSHKAKYHRGRAPNDPICVFGIIDTSFKPAIGYMEIVDRRNAENLPPIIESVVEKGSVFHSDEWRAYSQLKNCVFNLKTVNSSLHFVEPTNGVHTQHVESYKNTKKIANKKDVGGVPA